MTNMERFEQSKNYWSAAFDPQTAVERRLVTLIAFEDLLFERSMIEALSSADSKKAMSGERRQNGLAVSIDRLVQIMTTVQRRRLDASLPPTPPSNVIEMPKRSARTSARAVAHLEPASVPSLHPFGSARAAEPRKRSLRTTLNFPLASAA